MTENTLTPEQLRRRLAYATLSAAVILTPSLWPVGGNLAGDMQVSVAWTMTRLSPPHPRACQTGLARATGPAGTRCGSR